MVTLIIIGVLVAVIILLLFKKENSPNRGVKEGRTAPLDYTFDQGMDIMGSNLFEDASLADDIPALKKACNAYPNKSCRGFNTDGQFKVSAHADQLIDWDEATYDLDRGFYTRIF